MRQTSIPPVGFELTIPASARPQSYVLDRAASSIGMHNYVNYIKVDESLKNSYSICYHEVELTTFSYICLQVLYAYI
jgi:hypothetical protein